MSNNRRLKLIASALDLRRQDIARACALGGYQTSNSQADGWTRSAQSTKAASGNSEHTGRLNRAREMPDAAFDAFCEGLKPLLDELDAGK